MKSFKTIYQSGANEIVEKKSRFICDIIPCSTEEDAIAFIERIKKKHWNAAHHCYCYIVGNPSQNIMRYSDDGEPSGTAGQPMLDILKAKGLFNVVAVVTRYFGGTLLGTGGLIRAYGSAIKAGLEVVDIIEKKLYQVLDLMIDYTLLGKVQYLLNQYDVYVADTVYTDFVTIIGMIPVEEIQQYQKLLVEETNGQIKIQLGNIKHGSKLKDQFIVFD